jgi:hypothetical protein
MNIKYERHLKVDGDLIFLNSEIEVNGRIGLLSQIGQAGIYVKFPTVKNDSFINFKKIESLREILSEKALDD